MGSTEEETATAMSSAIEYGVVVGSMLELFERLLQDVFLPMIDPDKYA